MFRGIFSGSSSSGRGNEFVGQQVELGQQKLKIKKVLGEGGYGFVFSAQDVATGKDYALKRLMASDESTKNDIMQEINILKKLRGHANIIKFVGAASSGNEKMPHGMVEFLILTELCSGGPLIDYVQERGSTALPFEEMICIFAQTCNAVSHMHKQTPPIIHRDLKIENLLISTKGMIKLCDFGSSTTKALYPDASWSALQRGLAEDEIQKNTTPMYRAPEMVDLYSNHPITPKADVWALGCILYSLCYMEHPFKDSAKLKILNANYTVPQIESQISPLQPLIDTMFEVNPKERPSVDDVILELESVAAAKSIDLKKPIFPNAATETDYQVRSAMVSSGNMMGGSAIFGNVVKGAGVLFNNIKDVSSKVVQSVAGYVNNDLDLSYITSRIIAMSFPADGIESKFKNSIDEVRTYLDTKYMDHYVVINVSQRLYRVDKLNDRVFESGWNPKKSPPLNQLVSLCRKVNNFLRQDKKNVVVIHCLDGKTSTAIMVAAFLIFCKLLKQPALALDVFFLKRSPPAERTEITASQKRYLQYVSELVWEPRIVPHKRPMFLKTVKVCPVPLFNKARTGCRPFIEIYQGDQRILSTAQEIDQMREFLVQEKCIELSVNTKVIGDVTIHLYHGRSTFGGKVQGKLTSISVFSLQLHTGFIDSGMTSINIPRKELDIIDSDDQKYRPNFAVSLDFAFGSEASSRQQSYTEPWDKMNVEKLTPSVCFMSKEEYWDFHEEFGLGDLNDEKEAAQQSMKSSTSAEPVDKKVGHSLFFDTANGNENRTVQKEHNFDKIRENSNQSPAEFSTWAPISSNDSKESSNGIGESLINNHEQLLDFGSSSEEPVNNSADKTINSPMNTAAVNQKASSFFDDFGSLTVNSQFDDNFAKSPTSSKPKTNQNDKKDDIGVLLDFGSSDSSFASPGMQKSQNPENINSFNLDVNKEVHHNLKKNKSTSDLVETHTEDDFFQQLGERHSNKTTPTDEVNDLFSMKSNNFVDIFSTTSNPGSADSLTSMSMKHSSSDGDLLGEWGHHDSSTSSLKPNVVTNTNAKASNSVKNSQDVQQTTFDPFAELANFSAGNTKSQNQKPASVNQPQYTNQNMNTQQNQRAAKAPPTSTYKAAPNYHVGAATSGGSVFMGKYPAKGKQGGAWGQKPVSKDEFSDILGAQGFKPPTEKEKETLKQLKKTEMAEIDDPIQRKVRDWADGKERNIRALLCSLGSVLWEEEDKWKPCSMHQLIQPNDVKKMYRRACLCVHPDKHTGTPQEELSRAIFIELNEAWSIFEEAGLKPLY